MHMWVEEGGIGRREVLPNQALRVVGVPNKYIRHNRKVTRKIPKSYRLLARVVCVGLNGTRFKEKYTVEIWGLPGDYTRTPGSGKFREVQRIGVTKTPKGTRRKSRGVSGCGGQAPDRMYKGLALLSGRKPSRRAQEVAQRDFTTTRVE